MHKELDVALFPSIWPWQAQRDLQSYSAANGPWMRHLRKFTVCEMLQWCGSLSTILDHWLRELCSSSWILLKRWQPSISAQLWRPRVRFSMPWPVSASRVAKAAVCCYCIFHSILFPVSMATNAYHLSGVRPTYEIHISTMLFVRWLIFHILFKVGRLSTTAFNRKRRARFLCRWFCQALDHAVLPARQCGSGGSTHNWWWGQALVARFRWDGQLGLWGIPFENLAAYETDCHLPPECSRYAISMQVLFLR